MSRGYGTVERIFFCFLFVFFFFSSSSSFFFRFSYLFSILYISTHSYSNHFWSLAILNINSAHRKTKTSTGKPLSTPPLLGKNARGLGWKAALLSVSRISESTFFPFLFESTALKRFFFFQKGKNTLYNKTKGKFNAVSNVVTVFLR